MADAVPSLSLDEMIRLHPRFAMVKHYVIEPDQKGTWTVTTRFHGLDEEKFEGLSAGQCNQVRLAFSELGCPGVVAGFLL